LVTGRPLGTNLGPLSVRNAEPTCVPNLKEATMRTLTLISLALLMTACAETSAQRSDGDLDDAVAAALESGDESEALTLRRAFSGDEIYSPWVSTFSADGRYQAMVSWGNPGGLAVRDMESGEVRIVAPSGDNGFTYGGVFSNSGDRIAYQWWKDDHTVLRLVNADGSGMRDVFDPATLGAHQVTPLDWSRDDSTIFAQVYRWEDMERGEGAYWHLVSISLDDGTVDELKAGSGWRPLPGRSGFISPDGLYVAFSGLRYDSPDGADVSIISMDSGREEVLWGGALDQRVLGWSKDGTYLFVTSGPNLMPSLWAVPVADGHRTGDPILIRRDLHGIISGHVAGDRLVYHVVAETPTLYTVDVDLEEGRLLSEPVQEPGLIGWDGENPAWSPDGRYLAYLAGNEGMTIVVRSAGGNHRQEYRLPGSRRVNNLRWAADSRGLRVVAGESHVVYLDLQSGEFTDELLNPVSGPISRDGLTVYKPPRAFDLTAGQERYLFEWPREPTPGLCSGPAAGALSPSDDRLAVLSRGQRIPGGDVPTCIGVVSTEGGEVDVILKAPPGSLRPRGFAWSEDGSSLLFHRVAVEDEDPGISGLWALPVEGGTPKQLMSITRLLQVSLHPDGRRLAYRAGEENYELWVMECIEEALKR
jgi:hypothetical protein